MLTLVSIFQIPGVITNTTYRNGTNGTNGTCEALNGTALNGTAR